MPISLIGTNIVGKDPILSKKAVVIDSKTAAHIFLGGYSFVLYLASDRLCAAEGKCRISWFAKLYCMLYGFLSEQLVVQTNHW